MKKTSYGVYTGCSVTAQETPDMTIKVSSGVVYMENGDRIETIEEPVIEITTADPSEPRIDIVYIQNGIVYTFDGNPAAEPTAPTVDGLVLAEIAVAANATTIEAANITDKRKSLRSW